MASASRARVLSRDEDEDVDSSLAVPPSVTPTERRAIQGLRLDGDSFAELQDYSNAIFTGPVVLRNVRFAAGCKFDGAVFQERVNLSN